MTVTYSQTSWSLTDLYSAHDGADLQAAMQDLDARVAEFEKRRSELTPDISTSVFLELIRQQEQISELGHRISYFASLQFAADTQDQKAIAFMGNVEQKMAGLQNRTLFFDLWWKDLDAENAGRLMAEAGDYAYWLEEMRHYKPHTLTEPEEKIINIKNVTGASALDKLYNSITNRYTYRLEVAGEVKELTRGELMVYVRQYDADLRQKAYQELYRVYAGDGPILGQIYQALVRDWYNEQVELRHFASPIAARNLGNDIPDEVVDTLLDVCQQNAPVFQRFFRLKARVLGIERLRRYDIYAPVARSGKTFSFDRAAEMVLDSFAEFDEGIARLARRVFDQNHLDSEVRKGKSSGAFCASASPSLTPWVLLNYQSRAEDVATMAHEYGHAIHSMLAAGHSIFTFHPNLPLAETASTFGEMMLVDYLLAREDDPGVRRDMLFRQVDDAYATILRQSFFALFERQAHGMIQSGATVDEVSQAYFENLRTQFGDAVGLSEEFRWEWVSIPHFYQAPFYVYAYAFGQLLVFALYQQYKQEGKAFKPRYLKILAAGGSAAPVNVLGEAGIDIFQAAFWQGGFTVLSELIDQLEQL